MSVHIQAAEAAQHWQGRIIRLISNRENAVFEMALPDGRAALRLHRAGYQDAAAIRSEMWWCQALAEAGMPVPRPLPPLVRLADGSNASAVAWVEGAPLGRAATPFAAPLALVLDQHHALGRLLARLHATTDRLTLPPDFARPCWDADGLVGAQPVWGRFWDHPAATADQRRSLQRARRWLAEGLARHAVTGDFGLIHADVLRENILVNDNSLHLIDFDDCGLGFRSYDLGTALSQNLHEPAYAGIRDALIAGYTETRATTVETVEMFTLARACASVGWTMPRLAPGDPVHASHIARAVTLATRLIP